MRLVFPSDYGTRGCALVPIDIALLPIVAGMIAPLEDEWVWQEGDYPQAYRAVADLEAVMTQLCVAELVESNNRLYRLINYSLNGQVYEAGDNPPDSITPSIPDVPNTDISSPGMVRTLVVVRNMLSNALNGDINSDFALSPSIRELLQGIIDAFSADDADIGEIISQLEAIAVLLG